MSTVLEFQKCLNDGKFSTAVETNKLQLVEWEVNNLQMRYYSRRLLYYRDSFLLT